MKLLLDQNLSHRIVPALQEIFPESEQVCLVDMGGVSDKAIWDYALEHGYAIVTLDADFQEYSLLQGGAPLIVWLRCGNQRKEVVLEKLISNKDVIESADSDEEIWCLEVY